MAAVPFEFRGVVRFTGIGAGHLILTLVLGFAAINTGNNSLYLALSFLLGSLILSGLSSQGALRKISVELIYLEEPWAGRPAGGLLRVTNRSRLWNMRDLVLVMPELDAPILVEDLPRRSSREVAARFLFERRGRVSLQSMDCYTRYPFGLFLKKIQRRLSGEAIVFPRILGASEKREGFVPQAGPSRGTNRTGSGTDIYAFREYVRGDSLRHVHWRKSASLGRWIMKQPELEWVPSVVVIFDPVKPAGVSDEQFELLVSEATTFLRDALEEGRGVTLQLPQRLITGEGPIGRRGLFEALALVQPVDPSAGESLPLREAGDIVFSLRARHEPQVA